MRKAGREENCAISYCITTRSTNGERKVASHTKHGIGSSQCQLWASAGIDIDASERQLWVEAVGKRSRANKAENCFFYCRYRITATALFFFKLMKSRKIFYAEIECLCFHTVSVDCGRSREAQGWSGHTSAQPVHASSKMSYTQITFV